MRSDESLVGRMDRLGVERLARSAGLPAALAERVAQVVVGSRLSEDRRVEVYRELVSHFQDGLAEGLAPEELLEAFGDAGRAAAMIAEEKRVVTPEDRGGTGRGDVWPIRLWRDARYAVRRLMARPTFALTAILSLALGIGANAAMFTLVNDVILRKLPVQDPERLVDIYGSSPEEPFNPLSYADLQDFARGASSAFSMVGGMRLGITPYEEGGRVQQLVAELVTGNYFEMLGLPPGLGRLVDSSDAAAPGQTAVVVLSDRYWRRAFGADPGILGRQLRLSSEPYTVIGIAPRAFTGSLPGVAPDVYLPITMVNHIDPGGGDQLTSRSNHSVFAKGRLRPGASLAQARVALSAVARSLIDAHVGDWHEDSGISLIPASEVIVAPPVDKILRPIALLLMVVVGLVLVIACANLAGFLLARAVDRRKEVAVRLALGATRGQLITQLMVETVLLALVGGVVGVVLGRLALQGVLAADLPLPVPITLALSLDWRVLTFSVAVSVLAGMLFGLAPALQSTRLNLAGVIREESTGGGRSKGTLRSVLVSGQVAVSVVLLVAAGLFVRSLDVARRVDPGFGGQPAGLAWITIPGVDTASKLVTLDRIERRISELPGVRSVGAGENIHLNLVNQMYMTISVDGMSPPPGRDGFDVDAAAIDSGFVGAAGLQLVSGRNIRASDGDSSQGVVLVNQAFADRFWPGADPLGRRFRDGRHGREYEVVGVVKTAKIRSLAEEPRPFVYPALGQKDPSNVWLVARVAGSADGILEPMLKAIRDEAPDVLVIQTRTMARHLQIMTLPLKLGVSALGGFALLALLMASIGLYGTVSYAVAQRSREVGIRLSLGADRAMVVRLLLWSGFRLVLAGSVVGVILAFGLSRLLQGLLFGVPAADPLTFLAVPAILISVALLATWLPARRAGQVDPVRALRAD
jgi:putative ABC transport system permease protein